MPVKHISEWQSDNTFEISVNEWLEEHSFYEILNMQYSTMYHIHEGKILLSVFIEYREKLKKKGV